MCQKRYTVKSAILAVPLCCCLLPSAAWAVDWSANATLSEAVELNNNLYLRSMLAGGPFSNFVAGSYSTITANATARTPDSTFNIDGNISYRKYWGPGTEGTSTENVGGGLHARYEVKKETPGDRDYVDLSWHRQQTQFALLGDLGVVTNAMGDIDRTTLKGGIDRSLTSRDVVSLSAQSTLTTYDPPSAGTQFSDSIADATWRHQVNSVATLTESSDVEWLNFDSPANAQALFLRENIGADPHLVAAAFVSGHRWRKLCESPGRHRGVSFANNRRHDQRIRGRLHHRHAAHLQDAQEHHLDAVRLQDDRPERGRYTGRTDHDRRGD